MTVRGDEDPGVAEQAVRDLSILARLIFIFAIDTIRFVINMWKAIWLWLVIAICLAIAFTCREIILETMHVSGEIVFDVADETDSIVNTVGHGINKADSFLHLPHIPSLDLEGMVSSVKTIEDMQDYCDAVDTISWEIFYSLKFLTANNVCAKVRKMYPVEIFYVPFNGAVSWMIFNPAPFPGCKAPPHYKSCLLANIYRIFNFLAIALFYIIILVSYRRTIKFFLIHILVQSILFIVREAKKLLLKLRRH
jgi:hypothetical protein